MSDEPRPNSRNKYLKLGAIALGFVLVMVVAWKLGWLSGPKLRGAVRYARSLRVHRWAAIAFVGIFVVLALVGLPAAPVTMAGGAIFGFWLGGLLNWTGTVLGAATGYWLARIFRDGSIGHALKSMGSGATERIAKEHGFSAMLRLRLVPFMPQNALSIAAGLSGVPWWPYALGTAIGALPGTLVYTYFANTLLGGGGHEKHKVTVELVVASVLLIAVSFAPTLVKRMRGHGDAKAA